MAQGVAWWARRLGLRCTVVIPDTAPETKLAAIRRLGAEIVQVSFDEWWEIFRTRAYDGLDGRFVHAFSDAAVMAGNGTIGLEIFDDLPDVDAIVIPYGGGGLACGIASASARAGAAVQGLRVRKSQPRAPLAPSLAAGRPIRVDYEPSFVDGIGSPEVFPEMFELTRELVDGSLVVDVDEVAARRPAARRARTGRRRGSRRGRSPPRWPGAPVAARSSASSPEGTSTPRSCRTILGD